MKKVILAIVVLIAVFIIAFLAYRSGGDSTKNYVGNSAEECSRIQVLCVEGFQRFDDESGCGCEEI